MASHVWTRAYRHDSMGRWALSDGPTIPANGEVRPARGQRSPCPGGSRQLVQHRHGHVEVHAGVGHADAVRQIPGVPLVEVLTPGDEVALQHDATDRPLP